MDLSVIIINWNSKDYLQKCIGSILPDLRGTEFEIIVIDNGSYDGCDEMLRKHFKQVRFIQRGLNSGFAKANNEAFKVSSGRNILFLNPDTEVRDGAIRAIIRQLESLPRAGIVGGKLLNSDGTIQRTCIRVFPNILNQVLDSDELINRFPHSRLFGRKPFFEKSDASVEVDAVSGACLMTRRSVFETVGMFSSDYFMYSEDIDLCYRVRMAGFKVYYIPTAVVVHYGGGSSSQRKFSAFSNLMMLESRWHFFKKTRSIWYCWLYRLAMFAVSIIRIGAMLFILIPRRSRWKDLPIDSSLKKWVAILRWTLGMEKWVKTLSKSV